MTDYRRHYDPLPAHGKCIRLLTLHPGTGQDPLYIELQASLVNLCDENLSPYEALSYVWGSEDHPVWVYFGRFNRRIPQYFVRSPSLLVPHGQYSRPVTQNLAEALSHLRYPDRPRTMWIDAICIDQENDSEKSSQVAMMGEVFRRATRVIAWLGLATDTTTRALELIEEIGSQVKVASWTHRKLRPSTLAHTTSLSDNSSPLPYSAYDARCIADVINRPYFLRLWVRQEIGLATQASIHIGAYSTSWDNFATTVLCLYSKRYTPDRFSELKRSKGLFDALFTCQPKRYKVTNLIYKLGNARCKDPRDRLYAVLGLFQGRFNSIIPNYSVPTAEVYKDAILSHLSNHLSLDFLGGCGITDQSRRPPGLCSWVPDWSQAPYDYLPNSPTLCGTLFYPRFQYRHKNVLRVAGLPCGGEITNIVKRDRTNLVTIANSIYDFFTQMSPCLDLDRPYVAGGSLLDAMCYTLLLNQFPENFSDPREHQAISFDVVKKQIKHLITKGPIKSADDLGVEISGILNTIKKFALAWRYFITSDGYVGATLWHSRPHDKVVAIPGVGDPLVIRPLQDGTYHLVGRCYMHGVMQGEPFLGALPPRIHQFSKTHGEVDAVFYLNSQSGELTTRDPRFELLGINISAHNHTILEDGWVKVDVSVLKELGVQLVGFDLV